MQTSPWEGTVRTAPSELGALVNEVVTRDQAEPWSFGTGALMADVARRGLLMDRGVAERGDAAER